MSLSTKQLAMAGALLATLVAAYLSPDPEPVLLSERAVRASPTSPAATSPRPAPTTTRTDVLEIQARDALAEGELAPKLFSVPAWVRLAEQKKAAPAAAPTPVLAVASAPAVAPPLPFRVLGRYEDGGDVVFFLQHQDRNLVVRLGETIAEHYKVESLQGNLLTLRHLPTNQSQTLDVGGAS